MRADQERIDGEKVYLAEYFHLLVKNKGWRFAIAASDGAFHSLDCWIASQSGARYHIHFNLVGFPAALPRAYVKQPKPLLDSSGVAMTSVSAKQHVLGADSEGCTQICHYGSSQWHAKISLVKIVLRCKLWLDAYEQHLQTGQNLETWLPHPH